MKKLMVFGLLATLMAGCAMPARVDQMSSRSMQQAQPGHPYRAAVGVGEVTGGSATNPLWTSQIGSADFAQALAVSLDRAGLGAPADRATYQLQATLEKVDQPLIGLSMTVTAQVRYVLSEKLGGRVLFDKVINQPYTAQFSDAFLGFERLRVANEGAARVNIEQVVEALLQLGVSGVSVK